MKKMIIVTIGAVAGWLAIGFFGHYFSFMPTFGYILAALAFLLSGYSALTNNEDPIEDGRAIFIIGTAVFGLLTMIFAVLEHDVVR